ncbi:MAG: efflux RND transporter periplasmic adaptor subunit [Anaerolineae bacterium]|nr:efflux RND transporter periplasmic adaptor subunit [Anaerolineae bacterium]
MKHRTRYIVLGAVAIAAVIGFIIILQRQQAAQLTDKATTAVVERGSLLVAVSASGIIEPQDRVSLTFEQMGLVDEVLVEVGDEVKKGDVLARLDSEQLALQVRQAQASLTSAEAQLAQLKADARPEEVASAEANLRAADAQVNSADAQLARLRSGATEAEIAAAEAELASAMTEQKKAEDLHDRTMECFDIKIPGYYEGTICPALGPPEEQARYSLAAADKALVAAQARYDEMLAGADVDQLRAAEANVLAAAAQRDAVQAQLDLLLTGATEEQIAAVEAQVEQAKTALEQAELALELATLYAPFDGTVSAVNVKADEIAPTTPAVTLLDTSQFHITVSVDEIDVARLTEGQTAQVTIEAFPDVTLDGNLESIAPAATFEGSVVYYDVIIALDPTDTPIRADMTANATIVVEELSDVLLIPTWVVHVDNRSGQTYVDKQVGEKTERVDVTLGTRYEGVAQVLAGLSEGDVVVWVPTSRFGLQ